MIHGLCAGCGALLQCWVSAWGCWWGIEMLLGISRQGDVQKGLLRAVGGNPCSSRQGRGRSVSLAISQNQESRSSAGTCNIK